VLEAQQPVVVCAQVVVECEVLQRVVQLQVPAGPEIGVPFCGKTEEQEEATKNKENGV
jgi:hypothetical protein